MRESAAIENREPDQLVSMTEPPAQTGAERIMRLLDFLAQHRAFLVRSMILGFVLSTAIAFLIPARYEAVARLMPPDQTSGLGAAAFAALGSKVGDGMGSLASDLLGMRTTSATLVGILNSRTVQDDLINQFDLRKVYWRKKYYDARKILESRTSIGEDKKSGIITINVQDRDPQRAAQLALAYVDDLNGRISQLSTSSARREREFLEQRLQTVKVQLDEATLKLSRFSSKNMTFQPDIQGKAMIEAAATLQGQLIAAETELSGLQQIYGTENARVKAASARVGELRAKLRAMSGVGGESGDKIGQLYPSLEQLPLLGSTYADLARQAKIDEAVFEVLTRQYELAKVQEAKEIPTIRVLDEPVVPERKIWPPRLFIILSFTLMTMLFSVLYLRAKAGFSRLSGDDPRRVLLDRLAESPGMTWATGILGRNGPP